jgi:prolyl-tRNA editing enzyme YbaK/EbsC (Cys-tRNA(Pro) deacylase)
MIGVKPRNAGVAAALAAVGVDTDIMILDADARTAAAAADQLGCDVGAIANSLVFDSDGSPLLVMASGGQRVDTTLLARMLNANSITKASPQLVREATGQAIGEWRRPAIPAESGRWSTKALPPIRWCGRRRAHRTR